MRLRNFSSWAADRRGNIAVTFALAAVPVTLMLGMAVDLGNATRIRLALQDATDSAALSLARQMPTIADTAITSTAKSYIQASYGKTASVTVTNATVDRATVTATIDASADSPAYFSNLVGVATIPVTAHSVAKGMLLEIAMVLDTSGSMSESAGTGGSKINALKSASDAFLDAMYGTQTTSQRVSVSIVPFAASVNVGSANAAASWIDSTGASSLQYEDFSSKSKTRLQMFARMSNQSWAGCVISRPVSKDYDVTDAAPSNSDGDTLFVPWFAPDEPDDPYSGFNNNYLDDEGGNCGTTNQNNPGQSKLQKQAKTCKYKGASPANGLGPNYLCDSRPIMALTNNRASIDAAIAALQPKGNTNILEGFMWGWRSISPDAPFAEGRAYTAPSNRKVIVLMTDGQNNFGAANNDDMSAYSAYGYALKGRLGQVTNNNATLTSLMDGRVEKACANAKAQGIVIYTIAFGSGAQVSQQLLKECATDPSYAFAPQNSSDLAPVFKKIAQSINSLRIAE